MIVKMKKLSLVLYHKEREPFCAALQDLGVVHITENPDRDASSLSAPADAVKTAGAALAALTSAAAELDAAPAQKNDRPAADVLADIARIDTEKNSIDQELSYCAKTEAQLAPWGDFDPAIIDKLSSAGIAARFYQIEERTFGSLEVPGAILRKVGSLGKSALVMAFSKGDMPAIDAEEIRLPAESLGAVRKRISELIAHRDDVRRQLAALTAYTRTVQKHLVALRNALDLQTAHLDLSHHAGGTLLSLVGWLPASQEKKVRNFLSGFTAWSEISDPLPTDEVPVAVRNNAFARLFEPILKMYALPGYVEIDPTPFFAPFTMLFVGLCIGDVAYGTILLAGALFAWFKAPAAFKPFAMLVLILGASTIVSGMLLNGFFGITIFGGRGVSGFSIFPSGARYALFTPLATDRGTIYPMMSFSLLIGFLQLMLAFFLRIVNKIRIGGWKPAMVPLSFLLFSFGGLSSAAHINLLNLGIGSFAVCGICFGALLLMIPKTAAMIMFFSAFPLNILFSNMDKKGGDRVIMTIVDLYNNMISGIFGNILSYMRLFALGLTGGLLGGVFNQLAMMFITGKDGSVHWLSPLLPFTVLVLVAGHSLNFALCLVGAGVHPLRLTYVEFLQNLDLSWSGKPYKPLAKI